MAATETSLTYDRVYNFSAGPGSLPVEVLEEARDDMLNYKGSGMSVLNGRGRGDMVARMLVETPTRMSKEQKKLLEEFRASETGDECPAAKGFFGRVKEMFAS